MIFFPVRFFEEFSEAHEGTLLLNFFPARFFFKEFNDALGFVFGLIRLLFFLSGVEVFFLFVFFLVRVYCSNWLYHYCPFFRDESLWRRISHHSPGRSGMGNEEGWCGEGGGGLDGTGRGIIEGHRKRFLGGPGGIIARK